MKLSLLISIATFLLSSKIMARPPNGGIGDGYIYPASKPKDTTTYYAKPLHPPVKKPSGPPKAKPKVFKVIIQNQPDPNAQPANKEQIFKIIQIAKKQGGNSGDDKSIKILKIIHVKQQQNGQGGGWTT